jgi:hypothetical protein
MEVIILATPNLTELAREILQQDLTDLLQAFLEDHTNGLFS